MSRKIVVAVAGFALAVMLASPVLAAAKKVDCDAVMAELSAGKKVTEVAKDLKISRSSVYKCRRNAAKGTTKPTKESKAAESAPSKAEGAGAASPKTK